MSTICPKVRISCGSETDLLVYENLETKPWLCGNLLSHLQSAEARIVLRHKLKRKMAAPSHVMALMKSIHAPFGRSMDIAIEEAPMSHSLWNRTRRLMKKT